MRQPCPHQKKRHPNNLYHLLLNLIFWRVIEPFGVKPWNERGSHDHFRVAMKRGRSMSLRLQVTTSNLTNRYFPGHTKDPNSANTKKANERHDSLQRRNKYLWSSWSICVALEGLSVVHLMPSKIPVYCWSMKTTNHLSQTLRAKIFLWKLFKTSITSNHKTIEKERKLKTYSL